MERIDLSEQFGEILRRRRLKLGLTQEELAARADVTRNYVGMLEHGERNPTLNTVAMLAVALETSLGSIAAELDGLEPR